MTLLPNHKNISDKAFDLTIADRLNFISESNINTLPDFADPKIFDILDASFDIDTKGLNNEERRKLIKNALSIKYPEGTISSVKKALSAIFSEYEIEEIGNFQFRVFMNYLGIPDLDYHIKRALIAINQSKNVRSHFVGYNIILPTNKATMRIVNGMKLRI